MTASAPLPDGVRQMIDATNNSDRAAFLAAFTPDGVVDDWGRTFTGTAKIAAWNDAENIGARAHYLVQQVTVDGTTCTVALTVSGQRYNGPTTVTVELDGPLIRRMTIRA
ncbi:nuclear transport factor 2 family protein [Modestobacter lapidis]|nr:nuclear transport factor 2 family protein [Modestobacter lapidis]